MKLANQPKVEYESKKWSVLVVFINYVSKNSSLLTWYHEYSL